MPMKKPSGESDMDSVISHVTLMEQTVISLQNQVQSNTIELTTVKGNLQKAEQTITSLQTQLLTSVTDLATVKGKLQTAEEEIKTSKSEITAVKAELKLAETDIAILKHDLEKNPDPVEFALLKRDFEALKVNQNAPLQQINFTVIDAVSADVKTNTRDIQSLKSELIMTETEVNKTSSDIFITRTDVANMNSGVSLLNTKLNQSIQDAASNKGSIANLKSQLNDVSKSANLTSNSILSLETRLTSVENEYDTFQSRQNITEYEVTECKALGQSTAADLKTVHAEVNTISTAVNDLQVFVSKSANLTSNSILSLETRLTSVENEYDTFQSRQNITEYEVTECKALGQSTAADLKTVHAEVNAISTAVNVITNKTNKDVAFQVTLTGTTFGWTTLKFDKVLYNTGNGYNKTTGMFKAPVAGTYIFWANVLFLNDNKGNHEINIIKDSNTLASGWVTIHDDYVSVSTTTVAHLDAGNEVHFTTDSISNRIGGSEHSNYGGALLHAS